MRRERAQRMALAVMIAALGFFLAGCATGSGGAGGSAGGQEDLLKRAGFKLYTANSPKKLNYLNTLPLNQVVANLYHGHVHYLVRTNPKAPQCYIGDKAAYERYQQLAEQAAIARDRQQAADQRWDPEALEMWADSQGGGP